MKSNLTIEEFAAEFGATTEGVKKWLQDGLPCVKEKRTKRGHPLTLIPVVEGRLWLAANGARRFLKSTIKSEGHNTKHVEDVTTEPGVEAALVRLQRMELDTWTGYVEASKTDDPLSQQAWSKVHSEAVKRMVEAEAEIERRDTVRKEVEIGRAHV